MKGLGLADITELTGLGLICAGFWYLSPISGLIVTGLAVLAVGLSLAAKGSAK